MVGNDFDMEEIWALLAEEGQENLEAVENTLLKLEKKPASRDEIAVLFRALHTFKGTVRMMDFSTTEAVAHHAEDLVALVRDEGVTLDNEMIDLLLVATDKMRSLLEHILTHHTDSDPAEVTGLSAKLEDMVKLRKEQRGKSEPTPTPATEEAQSQPMEVPPGDVTEAQEEDMMSSREAEITPDGACDPETAGDDQHIPELEAPLVETPPEPGEIKPPDVEGIIFEPINLAENPEYVKMFLEVTLPEMERLQGLVAAINSASDLEHQSEYLRQMRDPVETLEVASERMGYVQVYGLLREIQVIGESGAQLLPELELRRLNDLSGLLMEEMGRIQGHPVAPLQDGSKPNLSDLFNQWYAMRISSDLEQLEGINRDLLAWSQSIAPGENEQLSGDVVGTLKMILGSLYQSCIYYHLDQAAHLTLALEDLCIHIQQEEISFNKLIASLFDTYLSQMREAFTAPGADNPEQPVTFEMILNLTQQIINENSKSPMLQITRSLIACLDIPVHFKDILTNENLAEINQALRARFNFYLIMADLDEDTEIGNVFQNWVESGFVTPITSISINSDRRCEFIFLIASPQDLETIRADLQKIDPQEKYLRVSECGLLGGVTPDAPPDSIKTKRFTESHETRIKTDNNFPAGTITEFTEMIGGLVADQSTLQRVIARLSEINPTEKILQLMRSHLDGINLGNVTWEKLRQDLESFWAPHATDVSTLAKTEVKLNAALVQLQEKTRSLDQRPASEILDPLQKVGQTLALRLGKQVQINCVGRDIELDQHTLAALYDMVRRLMAYCISESIEFPDKRQKSGKPVLSQLTISLTKTENLTQVVIEDDGYGLDKNKVLEHGKKLGWEAKGDSDKELVAWLFNPEFYSQDEKDINLAQIAVEVQSRRGKLNLIQKPSRGLRFTINMLLDIAVVDGMVVRIGDVRYVVPVYAIQRIFQPAAENLITAVADDMGCLLNLEGKVFPIRDLSSQADEQKNKVLNRLLVIIEKEPQPVALVVDELIGRQSVLVRPLSGHLTNARNVVGCALLGEDEVGMVLNLETL